MEKSYLYRKSSINYQLRLEIDPLFKMDKVLSLGSGDYDVWNSWIFATPPSIITMAEWSRWLSHGNMTVRVRILTVSEFFLSFFLNLFFYRSFFYRLWRQTFSIRIKSNWFETTKYHGNSLENCFKNAIDQYQVRTWSMRTGWQWMQNTVRIILKQYRFDWRQNSKTGQKLTNIGQNRLNRRCFFYFIFFK